VLVLAHGKKNKHASEDVSFSQNKETFGEEERLEKYEKIICSGAPREVTSSYLIIICKPHKLKQQCSEEVFLVYRSSFFIIKGSYFRYARIYGRND